MHEKKQKRQENTSLCMVSGDDLWGQAGGGVDGRGGDRWALLASSTYAGILPVYQQLLLVLVPSANPALLSARESLFVVDPFSLFNFFFFYDLQNFSNYRSCICVVFFRKVSEYRKV